MNPVEVRVLTQWDPVGLRLQIVQPIPGGGYDVLTFGDVMRVRVSEEDSRKQPPDSSTLRLSQDEGRAVYEALAEHFGHGTHNAASLRRDYTAERARVDKLIDAMIGVATR